MEGTKTSPKLQVTAENVGKPLVTVLGSWTTRDPGPRPDTVFKPLEQHPNMESLRLDLSQVTDWDTTLLCFVDKCRSWCEERQIKFEMDSIPEGMRRLLNLSRSVPEKKDAHPSAAHPESVLSRLGTRALDLVEETKGVITFLGECVLGFANLLRGRAQFRWTDAFLIMQQCGPQALGVVALINFLIGLILAFVGAIQLTQFGASIYVADLVAIGSVREMSCVMTGIILCGRTGAAFAAQLGTMKVNEEIDAFRTFGISAVEFLVLPRLLALFLMMPLLCVFADLIAIGGGYLVSITMLDITSTEYIDRTIAAITMKSFLLGIFKGAFFGILVAITGCLQGMKCGSNAAAVGESTTSAVVAGITSIIAADGIFAILCNALNL